MTVVWARRPRAPLPSRDLHVPGAGPAADGESPARMLRRHNTEARGWRARSSRQESVDHHVDESYFQGGGHLAWNFTYMRGDGGQMRYPLLLAPAAVLASGAPPAADGSVLHPYGHSLIY